MMPNKEGHKARKPDVAQVRNKVRHRTRTLVRVPVIGELLPGPGDLANTWNCPTSITVAVSR